MKAKSPVLALMAILLLSITAIEATFDKPNHGLSFLPPTLTAPADGTTNVQLPVTFMGAGWTNAIIEIYEDNTFDRPANINLSGYTPVSGYPKTISNIDNDVSGIAWNPNVPSRLFMINNNPTEIYVTDLEGKNAKTITLSGFDDTEDIVHISGNTFAIVEEKRHRVSYIEINPTNNNINVTEVIKSFQLSGLSLAPNKGLEGVSYDPVNNMLYAIAERPLNLYSWSAANSGTFPNPIVGTVPASFGMTDQSAIYHLGQAQGLDNLNVKDRFVLLSDESHKIVETDINFNNYGSLILPALDEGITNPTSERDSTKFEGITMDGEGNIYLVSEENFLYKYVNKNCNRSLIPTGALVHTEQNINGNIYTVPPNTLEAGKTYSWRVVTDGQCSDFWSFTTALPKCGIIVNSETIQCNDNDTPTDCTDDTFTITVTAMVNNGSGSYIVNDGNNTSLPTPSGMPMTLGPYSADDSTVRQLTYSDASDSSCTLPTAGIGPVASCSTNCLYTVNSQISISRDDAQEINGIVDISRHTLELGRHPAGLIFKGLDIPQGAKIQQAYIQFSSNTPSSELTILTIRGENRNPEDFDNPLVNYIVNRPKTTNSVTWNVPVWTEAPSRDALQKTPDISSVIQEIVDRNSFNGNIGIIITGTGRRVATAYDGNRTQAAELVIVYGSDEDCPPAGMPCNTRPNFETDGQCNCVEIPSCNNVTAVTAVITDGNNDVEENGRTGYIYSNSSDLEMFREVRNDQIIALRYTGVPVLQGAQICNAHIQFTVADTRNLSGEWRIYVEDSPASAPFVNTKNNVSARTRTNGFIWQPPFWNTVGASGSDQQTVNIASAIQQVISKPDWDGTITIILEGTGRRVAESFEGSPENKAPVLHIETVNSTGTF